MYKKCHRILGGNKQRNQPTNQLMTYTVIQSVNLNPVSAEPMLTLSIQTCA